MSINIFYIFKRGRPPQIIIYITVQEQRTRFPRINASGEHSSPLHILRITAICGDVRCTLSFTLQSTDFPSVQEILNHIKFAVCSQKHIPRILQHRIHELVTLNSVGTFMRLVIKLYQCNYIRILIGKCEVDML